MNGLAAAQAKYDAQVPAWVDQVEPEFTTKHIEYFIADFAAAPDAKAFWREYVSSDYDGCAEVMQDAAKASVKGFSSVALWRWAKECAIEKFELDMQDARENGN